MQRCPFCDADLGDGGERLRAGRCLQCGSVVSGGSSAAPVPVDGDEEHVSIRDIVRTLTSRHGLPATESSAPLPASTLVSAAPVGSLLASPPDRGPSAAATGQVDKIWTSSLTANARPGMTLKASSGGVDPAVSTLHVRPYRIGQPGEASGPDSEYELIETIGEGGVGVVYAARQASVDRTVALKMLKAEFAHKSDHRNKFLSEAVVTGELDHPNIVPIHDLGTSHDGNLFYAMKRVKGTPWSQVIAERPLADNLRILMSVADAIAFAHSRGVIHRDLKPENIMLGDFGEVLVMDWGIALSTPMFVKSGRISQSTSMGGTPAYMAPEMATGPLDTIGPAADIYLLGAILYEIVTGRAPHTGKDVMSCLYAAARNDIQPTDKSGELVEIAQKAMSTLPAKRHASVQDFQNAIRDYESHSESIVLSTRADEELVHARSSRNYQDFAQALFGFEEARELWSGNQRAKAGETEARLAYASCALEKGDYDLGLSLLNEREAAQVPLWKKLTVAQRERNARQSRFRNLRRIALGLAATIFIVVTCGLFWIGSQYRIIELQNLQLSSTITQLNSTTTALKTETENLAASKRVLEAKEQTLQAQKSQLQVEKDRADGEAEAARVAQQAEMAASYLAQIGVSSERIANNSFLDARRLLAEYQGTDRAFFRHWEWSHLTHLCDLEQQTIPLTARVECLARSADGSLVAAGLSSGKIHVWQADWATGSLVPGQILLYNGPVTTVAVSSDGLWLAAAGDIGSGLIQVWKRSAAGEDFTPRKPLHGHRSGVLSLAFAPAGQELLSGSRDETARRWNLATGGEIEVFRGHFGPVWSVAYSPGGLEAATAGEDATVRIWTFGVSAKPRIYRGHTGSVYAVAFSPAGDLVASGGRDRAVHLWNPRAVLPFDFAAVERELTQELRGVVAPEARQTRHVPLAALNGHGAEIRAIAFGSDAASLLSAAHDNTVRLWRFRLAADDPAYQTTLRGHGGWVRGCLLASDQRLAISGGHDEQVKIWNIDAYEEVRQLRGHDDAVTWAAFSRDGERIVTAGRDRQAILWSRSGKTPPLPLVEESGAAAGIRLQEGHEFLATTALFFPAGDRRLLTAAGDNTVRIWDRLTGGQVRRLDGTGTISVAAISPDGKWVLTGSDGKDALLWQTDEPSIPPQRLTGNLAEVSAVAFSPTTKLADLRIATGDVAGTVRLWRYDTSTERWMAHAQLRGHEPGYSIAGVRFTPDSRRVITACQDHTVMLYDTETGTRVSAGVFRHPDAVRALDLSADGGQAVTLCSLGGDSCRLFVWDLARGTERHCDVNLPGETISSVAYHHDQASAILTSSSGNASRLWRWPLGASQIEPLWPDHRIRGIVWAATPSSDGAQLLAVGGSQARLLNSRTGEQERTFSPHGAVTSANFSAGGERIVTSSVDGDVKIWIADSGDPNYGRVAVKIPRAHAVDGVPYGVNFASFSPLPQDDGSLLLATAGDDGTARLWRVAGGEASMVRTLRGHEGRVRSVVFSPDGQGVLTASDDGTARLWTAAEQVGDDVLVQFGHPAAVLLAEFSPDGSRIITGCDDNIARVWNPQSGREPLMLLEGHTAAVTSASISADGRRAVTGSQDGVARIWDLDAQKEVLTLKRHGAEVTSVHFSPDGRSVLTSSLDETALVWPSVNISPSIKLSAPTFAVEAAATSGPVDLLAEVRDPDSPTLAGGSLTAQANQAEVELLITTQGDLLSDNEQIFWSAAGVAPRLIATLDRQASVPGKLVLALAEDCTPALAQQLLRAIRWQSPSPLVGELVIRCQLAEQEQSPGNLAEVRIKPTVAGELPLAATP